MKRRDIELERYEVRFDTKLRRERYYAIDKEGNEYEMPPAFKEMYTDDYLQIRETSSEMPEVYDLPEGNFWIPIRTAPLNTIEKLRKVRS